MTGIAGILGVAALTSCTSGPVPSVKPACADPHLAVYRLAWHDEFDGDSVDETKWNYRTGSAWWSTQQKQNISVSGGVMRIALRKEQAGAMAYTAGGLISKPEFRYGYYEARFRCPPGKGWHTSFWLMKTNGSQQEIDICENDSIDPRRYSVNTHRYDPVHTSMGFKIVETPDLAAAFHTWGCEFTPEKVTYYFEGRQAASFPVDLVRHSDQSIWLTSLAASLSGTDCVDDGRLPAAAEYDYVRYFEPPTPYAPPAGQAEKPRDPVRAFGLDELHARGGLPNFAARLAKGGEVRIAYLGGSITESTGWRTYTREWLQKRHRKAKPAEIHAAISGTGSDFGACRLQREVLDHKPDLLFVEFAVNDGGMSPGRIVQTMEGIVRQTWRANPLTDICFVYTVNKGDLKTIQSGRLQPSVAAMERVAAHYGLPGVNFGIEVARLEQEGRLLMSGALPTSDAGRAAIGNRLVFSGDGTHPHHQTGHVLYIESFARAWPFLGTQPAGAHILPAPLDAENWENAALLPFDRVASAGGWQRLPPEAPQVGGARISGRVQGQLQQTPPWIATNAGASLSFAFTGRAFGLYGLKGPDAGTFRVTVDDLPPVEDALFDSWCVPGRWRIKPWFYPRPLPDGPHRVRIELTGSAPDKRALLKAADATGLDGRALIVSDVLIVGTPAAADR